MKQTLPRTIFLSLIFLICSIAKAKEQYVFTSISHDEGLNSTVNCIYKEKDGDVWIGTQNGLYSFNGLHLRHHDTPHLKGRRISDICEDTKGNLWILTDRFLLKRSIDDDVFTQMNPGNIKQPFHGILCDSTGVWISSRTNLYRYTYDEEELSLFTQVDTGSPFSIRSLSEINDSTLVCAGHEGIMMLDIRNKTLREPAFGSDKSVYAMITDSKGHLWIASYNRGIEVYDNHERLVCTYDTDNSSLSNNIVLCMTERDSMIWAGTDGGGINIIDPSTRQIKTLINVAGDISSFPSHSIKSIHTDTHGNIWAGSIRNGLINISQSEMKTYRDCHIGLNSGLSNPTVLCLHQDSHSGLIWIGTDGEGINSYDPVSRKFQHYSSTLKKKIVSIAGYSESELLLSSFAVRLWLLNKMTGQLRPFEIHDLDINHLIQFTGRSLNLANEQDGDILLVSNHICRLDKKTGRCTRLNTNSGNAAGNFYIIGHGNNEIWLHDEYNIYRITEGSDTVEKVASHSDAVIRSGHMGNADDIWMASEHGLCRFSIRENSFTHIETPLFSEAVSVVCDKDSRIWMGTDKGLFAYLDGNGSFAMFGESDGATSNEYLSKPRLLSNDGDVYMGGTRGLLRINREYEIDEMENPQIRLDYLEVDNTPIKKEDENRYRIPRTCRVVEIGVSVSEKDIFRNKRFRFTLSGNGKTYETSSPSLRIKNLPGLGKNEVMVSCTRRDGEWTEPTRIMTLVVPVPWYRSWWFILTLIIFTLVVMRLRTTVLLRKKDQQTYEEKVRMMINMSHELRTPLTLIMAPLKRLLKGMDPEAEHYATLSRIYRQSRRMKDMLNMVLDVRKMEVGKDRMKIESTDFNRWILDTTQDITNEEHLDGIEIIYDLDPRIQSVELDRRKCDTVVTNILMNAVKHSVNGDTITIRTELKENGSVCTSISDQGPGLNDIDISQLFTHFYQSTKEQYGSGIGLAYSKLLIELHNGSIGAWNNADKGATFWWEIPVKYNGKADLEIPAKAYLNELVGANEDWDMIAPESDGFSTHEMTLMLVEDNVDLLEFLKEALTSDFAEIITVQSGNKAMETIRHGKLPDIIVSDVNMSDGNGYQLCKEIKSSEKYNHIPVILLTANGEEKSQSDSYRVGADAFLAKPFEIETLMEQMRGLLRKKEDIHKKYLDTGNKTGKHEYGSKDERFILQLNKIISDHLGDPELDQVMLCREMGMSRALLYNKMKAITGAGAKEYITRIRIEKAKSLIESTDLSIADISEMTGFSSQSYFSTAFKNYTGKTPTKYKQDIRTGC